jgi:hypothetical protein
MTSGAGIASAAYTSQNDFNRPAFVTPMTRRLRHRPLMLGNVDYTSLRKS